MASSMGAIRAAADVPTGEAAAMALAERGQLSQAASVWAESARRAAQSGDVSAEWRAQLRMAEVAVQLGYLTLARSSVQRAEVLSRRGLERAATLGISGRVWLALDEPERARVQLLDALEQARTHAATAIEATVGSDLGLALAALGQTEDATATLEAALAAALRADREALALSVHARLARLEAEQGSGAELEARLAGLEPRFTALPPSHDVATSWLALARVARDYGETRADTDTRDPWATRAQAFVDRAQTQALALQDPSVNAAAAIMSGESSLERGEVAEAIDFARVARAAAARADDPDLRLEALTLLGRARRASGDRAGAIDALAQAVSLLDERRAARSLQSSGDDASRARTVRAEQRDAELRLELVDLVLQRAAGREGDARAADLARALAVVEQSKVTELRDYFRDDCVDAWRERLERPDRISPTAAIVYPIPLPDRLEVLVLHRGRIERFAAPIGAERVEAETRTLRRYAVNRTGHRYRTPARLLYDWIIRPIETHLDEIAVDTLVFVPGGALRTIPMSVLMDGDDYLITRYALATIPALELTDPMPLRRERAELFLGGVSKPRDGFAALDGVPDELEAVRAQYGRGTVLLDEAFLRAAVRESLEKTTFSIVHLATHAQFAGDTDDTFLLAWDGRIDMDALAEAIGAFRFRDTPLDLLVLSACETAAGDDRAALGLAGVAVKAGARSALATLWSVDDEATRRVITVFYAALADPEVSRAEALRRAQRALIEDQTYDHPAYWAPFLMISGWM